MLYSSPTRSHQLRADSSTHHTLLNQCLHKRILCKSMPATASSKLLPSSSSTRSRNFCSFPQNQLPLQICHAGILVGITQLSLNARRKTMVITSRAAALLVRLLEAISNRITSVLTLSAARMSARTFGSVILSSSIKYSNAGLPATFVADQVRQHLQEVRFTTSKSRKSRHRYDQYLRQCLGGNLKRMRQNVSRAPVSLLFLKFNLTVASST